MKKSSLHFLVDECVLIGITKELLSRKFDVYDPRLKNTRGMSDSAIIELASKEKRIIITRDLWFSFPVVEKQKIGGVILLRFRAEVKAFIIVDFFIKFLLSKNFVKCYNSIVVITPSGIRIRKLSIC